MAVSAHNGHNRVIYVIESDSTLYYTALSLATLLASAESNSGLYNKAWSPLYYSMGVLYPENSQLFRLRRDSNSQPQHHHHTITGRCCIIPTHKKCGGQLPTPVMTACQHL